MKNKARHTTVYSLSEVIEKIEPFHTSLIESLNESVESLQSSPTGTPRERGLTIVSEIEESKSNQRFITLSLAGIHLNA